MVSRRRLPEPGRAGGGSRAGFREACQPRRGEWEKKRAEVAAEQERRRNLEAAIVSYVQPGEMQPERDFHFQKASDVAPVHLSGRAGRRHPRWFSFDVPVDPAHPMKLVVTYNTQERPRRTFDILVNGEKIARETVEAWAGPGNPSRFFDQEYPLPGSILRSATRVTVRFGGRTAAPHRGLRHPHRPRRCGAKEVIQPEARPRGYRHRLNAPVSRAVPASRSAADTVCLPYQETLGT